MGGYMVSGVFIGILFIIFGLLRYELDCVEKRLDFVEKRTNDLEERLKHLELDDFMKIAFQTNPERFDLMIKNKMEAIVDDKLQKHKEDMKKIIEKI